MVNQKGYITVLLIYLGLKSSLVQQIESKIQLKVMTTDSGQIKNLNIASQIQMLLVFDSNRTLRFRECLNLLKQLKTLLGEQIEFKARNVADQTEKKNQIGTASGDRTRENCSWMLVINQVVIEFHELEYGLNDLVDWVKKRTRMHLHRISSTEQFYKVSNQYFALVYVLNKRKQIFKKKNKEEREEVLKLLRSLSAEFPYTHVYYSFDYSVNNQLKLDLGHSLILVRGFGDGHKTLYEKEVLKYQNMRNLVERYRFPLVMFWNKHILDFMLQERQDLALLVLRKGKNFHLEAAFQRIAQMFQNPKTKFAIIAIEGNQVTHSKKKMLDLLGVKPHSVIPTLFGVSFEDQSSKIRVVKCDNVTERGIKGFLGSLNGIPNSEHCMQNQLLSRSRKHRTFIPLNLDSFNLVLNSRSHHSKVVLAYNSSQERNNSLLTTVSNIARRWPKEKPKPKPRFFKMDLAFNAWPQSLSMLSHDKPQLTVIRRVRDQQGQRNLVVSEEIKSSSEVESILMRNAFPVPNTQPKKEIGIN